MGVMVFRTLMHVVGGWLGSRRFGSQSWSARDLCRSTSRQILLNRTTASVAWSAKHVGVFKNTGSLLKVALGFVCWVPRTFGNQQRISSIHRGIPDIGSNMFLRV